MAPHPRLFLPLTRLRRLAFAGAPATLDPLDALADLTALIVDGQVIE